jgi:hypothetical protein
MDLNQHSRLLLHRDQLRHSFLHRHDVRSNGKALSIARKFLKPAQPQEYPD